jgi:uncharacterized membrane protein YqaE (UPF0057 family)
MRHSPATIAAAALLPPLGAFRARGVGRDFWITTGLTVLGFIPGMAYALHLVLLSDEPRAAA